MVQVDLNERSHAALKLYKTLSDHRSYSQSVIELMEDAGHEVPDEAISNEEMIRRVFG
ncbi:hypothetical protein [Salinigranum halophilum]|uniref:hypothetical protein n=1 Tax=Salinigranum halophilum TaxID=2565931 RepID=UPI0013762533|nr:hypothetical protein [Salinigranum halophilum]